MSTNTVETRVVQIQFDNQKFEKNIAKTQKSLEKLETSMQFKGSKKELKDLQKSLENVKTDELQKNIDAADKSVTKFTLGLKEIIKYKIVGRVIDKMTDSAVRFIKQMSGINSITAGWAAYEEQITTIGGVVNNVLSKYDGDRTAALEEVTEAMATLQWYADETSFSFDTMSNGIRQFTTSGLDVSAATEAAMGVTALAGASKEFDAQKISSAMNAVAKAMQTGNMNLMQWNTLTQTAGIVSEEFSKQLLEAAAAEGKLIKSSNGQYRTKKGGALVTTENIADTLKYDWLTKDVLSNVLGEYSAASTAAEKIIAGYNADTLDETITNMIDTIMEKENWSELTASHMIDIMKNEEYAKTLKELGYDFSELSLKAFESSQQATSATQAIMAVGEASKAQFQKIFGYIFGNADESTKVWTKLANDLNTLFVGPIYTLSDIFEEWSGLTEGGASDFREAFGNLMDFAVSLRETFDSAWEAVFGDVLEDGVTLLQRATKWLKKFTERLKTSEKAQKVIKTILQVIFTSIKMLGKVLKAIFKIIKSLWPLLKAMFGALGLFIEWMAESVSALADWIAQSKLAEKIANKFKVVLEKLGSIFKQIGQWLKEKLVAVIEWWNSSEAPKKVVAWFKDIWAYFKEHSLVDSTRYAFEKLEEAIWKLFKTIEEKWPKVKEFWDKFKNNKIVQVIKNIAIAIWSTIKNLFLATAGLVEKFSQDFKTSPFETLKEMLLKIAKVFLIIASFKMIYRVIDIMKEASWALDSIRSYFNAKKVIRWAEVLLALSASLYLVAKAIREISEIQSGAWSAIGKVMVLLAAITGMTIAIIAVANAAPKGDRAVVQMTGLALGIALMALAMRKVTDACKDLSWSDLWKSVIMFTTMVSIFAGAMTLIRLGKKFSTPMLISFLKVVLALKLITASMISFMEAAAKLTVGDVFATVGLIAAIDSLLVAMIFMNKYGAGTLSNTVVVFAGIAVALLAFSQLLKLILSMKDIATFDNILLVVETIGGMTLIGAAWYGVSKVASLIPITRTRMVSKNIVATMSGIGVGLLSLILAMKVAEMLNPSKLLRSGVTVLIMFSIIAGFVVAMNKLSQIVDRDLGNKKWQSVKTNPAASALLAISITIFAMIAAIKILEYISDASLIRGGKIIGTVFAILALAVILINVSAKKVDGKAMASTYKLVIGIMAVIALVLVMASYLEKVGEAYIYKAIDVLAVIMSLITTAIILMLYSARQIDKNKMSTSGLIALMAGVVGIIVATTVMTKLVNTVGAGAIVGTIFMLITMFGGLALLFITVNKAKDATFKVAGIMGVMVAIMIGMTYVMAVLSNCNNVGMSIAALGAIILAVGLFAIIIEIYAEIDIKDAIKGFVLMSAMLVLIGAFVTIMALILNNKNAIQTSIGTVMALSVLLIVFAGIAVAFGLLFKDFTSVGIALASLAGIVVLIIGFMAALGGLLRVFNNDYKTFADTLNSINGGNLAAVAAGILLLSVAGLASLGGFAALCLSIKNFAKTATKLDWNKLNDMFDVLTRFADFGEKTINTVDTFAKLSDCMESTIEFVKIAKKIKQKDIDNIRLTVDKMFADSNSVTSKMIDAFNVTSNNSIDTMSLTDMLVDMVNVFEKIDDVKIRTSDTLFHNSTSTQIDGMIEFMGRIARALIKVKTDLDSVDYQDTDFDKVAPMIETAGSIMDIISKFRTETKVVTDSKGYSETDISKIEIPDNLVEFIGQVIELYADKISKWAGKMGDGASANYEAIADCMQGLGDILDVAYEFDTAKIVGASFLFQTLSDMLTTVNGLPLDGSFTAKKDVLLEAFEFINTIYQNYGMSDWSNFWRSGTNLDRYLEVAKELTNEKTGVQTIEWANLGKVVFTEGTKNELLSAFETIEQLYPLLVNTRKIDSSTMKGFKAICNLFTGDDINWSKLNEFEFTTDENNDRSTPYLRAAEVINKISSELESIKLGKKDVSGVFSTLNSFVKNANALTTLLQPAYTNVVNLKTFSNILADCAAYANAVKAEDFSKFTGYMLNAAQGFVTILSMSYDKNKIRTFFSFMNLIIDLANKMSVLDYAVIETAEYLDKFTQNLLNLAEKADEMQNKINAYLIYTPRLDLSQIKDDASNLADILKIPDFTISSAKNTSGTVNGNWYSNILGKITNGRFYDGVNVTINQEINTDSTISATEYDVSRASISAVKGPFISALWDMISPFSRKEEK